MLPNTNYKIIILTIIILTIIIINSYNNIISIEYYLQSINNKKNSIIKLNKRKKEMEKTKTKPTEIQKEKETKPQQKSHKKRVRETLYIVMKVVFYYSDLITDLLLILEIF